MKLGKLIMRTAEKLSRNGEAPDRREPGELMRKADTLGWELSAALTSAFPEREAAEKARLEADDALRKPIVGAEPMRRGVSVAVRVTFEDGSEGVYKPRVRETAVRGGVRPGTFALREWLAAQVDRAAGFDVVPPTVLREGPEGMGSVQKLMSGRAPIDDLKLMGTWERDAKPGDLMRLAAFDRLVGQTDRKGDNFLIEEDGSLDAVDNSLIHSRSGFVNLMTKGMNLPAMLYARRKAEADPKDRQELLGRLERLRGSRDVLGALKRCYDLALGEDAEEAWKAFTGELDAIVRKKDL